jgi:hypothetical protein
LLSRIGGFLADETATQCDGIQGGRQARCIRCSRFDKRVGVARLLGRWLCSRGKRMVVEEHNVCHVGVSRESPDTGKAQGRNVVGRSSISTHFWSVDKGAMGHVESSKAANGHQQQGSLGPRPTPVATRAQSVCAHSQMQIVEDAFHGIG